MDLKTLMFSSDDETSSTTETDDDILNLFENPPKKRTKILNFLENTVQEYTDEEFFSHFRMSRTLADHIIDNIREANVIPKHLFGREKIIPKKAFLLTLWYLANQETFRQISDRWNVSMSSAYRIIEKVTDYFVSVSSNYIIWPDAVRSVSIINGFRSKKGINGIIGAIDGSHIPIKKPIKDAEVYVNRKGYHSILIQAVVDHEKIFTDIYCGEPGSQHDARLLRKSPLFAKASNNDTVFVNNTFLLGDSAYPNLKWLVPPFKDNGNLSNEQRLFNYKHSSSRIVVENAFGLLKGRFRRLVRFDNMNIDLIIKCVITACVLHNICMQNKEKEVELCEEDIDVEDNELDDDDVNDRRNEIFTQML